MPSSSSGTTSTEVTLRSFHDTILAHLYYHAHTSSCAIPYKLVPSLRNLDDQLPTKINTIFSTILDTPPPSPQQTPSHSPSSFTNLTALAYSSTPDRPKHEIMYSSLSSSARQSLNDIASARPTPAAVIDSLAIWIERLAQVLQHKGRTSEGQEAYALLAEVQRWSEEVERAMEELEREQDRLSRGVEGVCLRWGV
ncbi:hypothetical protein KVT40_003969 [Elsinoe batatas]|uniref:Uncharacterized protein n=1 Tax=Elsinoe batatas TaxID=2601811 RepID=A0A8K0PFP8_9PEZI|nr:hypothetical protein KVT40_003969 [Elsinoe batatas]